MTDLLGSASAPAAARLAQLRARRAAARPRVLAAMSGGVDSAVAAGLLVAAGYEVVGVTMRLWAEGREEQRDSGCCSLDAVEDARRAASILGIPYYVLDLRESFQRGVIDEFVNAYASGDTPNPCLRCNQRVKFTALLQRARLLGCAFLATGHHARLEPEAPWGRPVLRRGADLQKDQSYVLYPIRRCDLGRVIFPVGTLTKAEVREQAAAWGLGVAAKPDSQEICFLPEGDYRALLRRERPDALRPGPILKDGQVVGSHEGLAGYTVGQRRGLGAAGPQPLYVLKLDVERNALHVATRDQLGVGELELREVRYHDASPRRPFDASVQVRYHGEAVAATVLPGPAGRARVELHGDLRAVAPGQAAVFYREDAVLGGGIIALTTAA